MVQKNFKLSAIPFMFSLNSDYSDLCAIQLKDLGNINLPQSVCVIRNYENAFETENLPVMLQIPTTTEELFNMMTQTPTICGEYHITEQGTILWNLHKPIVIEIQMDPTDCCISIIKPFCGKIKNEIIHWHPTIFEIYDEVCKIGKQGNILVIHTFLSLANVTYIGEKENYPNKMKKRCIFRKEYFLEAQ